MHGLNPNHQFRITVPYEKLHCVFDAQGVGYEYDEPPRVFTLGMKYWVQEWLTDKEWSLAPNETGTYINYATFAFDDEQVALQCKLTFL